MSTLPRPRAARARGGPRYPEEDLVLGRYRLLAPIGSGGHGTVWVAADEQRPRRVAVKRVPVSGDHPNERARLAREGRAAARLEHPAIVTLLETGEDPAAHYIVCELVEGSSLASHYRENGLEDHAVIEICAAVAEALIHAHGRGVVHRDVKPQNVIVPSEPAQAGTPAKLTDFGVARIAGEQSLTATGEVIGTFEYMSPEQALGRPAGPPSDLYSLALTLYEGLTGANPLRGETVAATAARIGTPVEPLKDRRPDLPARLCRAVDQALAPEPARRGTLEELRDALESALVERAPRRPLALPALVRIPLTPRTGRFLAAAGAAALAASLTATLAPQQGASIALAAAALSAVLTAASPALGWLLAALASLAWLGAAGQAGTALVLAAALVAAPALLPGRPRLWSLAVLAPLLGVAGLAACYPALAGRAARTTLSRAALGALGYWWLSAAETLSGRRLLFGVGAGTRPRGTWSGSLGRAVDHALAPLFTDGRLLTAVVWALAAAALPLIVRARGLKLRAAFAVAWAAALLVGSALLASHLGVARSPVTLPAVALAGLLAFLGAGIAFQERPDVA